MEKSLRLDKYLADAGTGTRSQVKQMIRKGQITVNGVPVKKPEQKVDVEKDRVEVMGKEIRYQKYRYLLLHKTAGVVSATEDKK